MREIVWLLFSSFSNHLFSGGKFIPFHLYLYIRDLICVILSRFLLLFLCNLMPILHHVESIYYLFYRWDLLLLFCFLSNQHNRYMVLDLDLFYEICNTITEHNRRQSHYSSLIPIYFDIYFQLNQKVIL